jgi:hypothetical protein
MRSLVGDISVHEREGAHATEVKGKRQRSRNLEGSGDKFYQSTLLQMAEK